MTERRLDAVIDIARAERESLRWVMLTALWHARPYGAEESLLLRVAADVPLRASADAVRRELAWLEGRNLVAVGREGPLWWAKLAALGEDVYDYRAEAPVGLARPPRW